MWIVYAHVVTIFLGFALTFGAGIILGQMLQSGDVRTIRTAVKVGLPTQIAGGVFVLVAAIFGGVAANALHFDFHARWLWLAAVLVAVLLLDGFARRGPRFRRIAAAAKQSSDDAPSPELRALINDRFEVIGNIVSALIWVYILALMVLKPA